MIEGQGCGSRETRHMDSAINEKRAAARTIGKRRREAASEFGQSVVRGRVTSLIADASATSGKRLSSTRSTSHAVHFIAICGSHTRDVFWQTLPPRTVVSQTVHRHSNTTSNSFYDADSFTDRKRRSSSRFNISETIKLLYSRKDSTKQSSKYKQHIMSDQATKDAVARERIITHMNADHHDSVLPNCPPYLLMSRSLRMTDCR